MWPFSASGSTGTPPIDVRAGPPAGVDGKDETGAEEKCPVDHVTRSVWLAQSRQNAAAGGGGGGGGTSAAQETNSALAFLSAGEKAASTQRQSRPETITVDRSKPPSNLSVDRVVSSIPRFGSSAAAKNSSPSPDAPPTDPSTSANWVYPSPAQFFSAMARKNHNPDARDMDVVVPIHNAVNERAWQQIQEWERMADTGSWTACGGPQLVSFKGRPRDVTWHAWTRGLLGYRKPFDRHDWVIDRCGRRVKYVIDFYTGRAEGGAPSLSFYLDVRPSPADVEGIRMRILRLFTRPTRPLPATAS